MFNKAEERTVTARAKYKRYDNRPITHIPVFEKGEYVPNNRPLAEAKTGKEKEDEISQSKLRYKMTGPYTGISPTLKTVTVEHSNEEVNESNYRFIHDPNSEVKDPDQ